MLASVSGTGDISESVKIQLKDLNIQKMVSLPNPLYISLVISIVSAVLIFASFFNPWIENKHDNEGYAIIHQGGLTFYQLFNDFGSYKLKTFIRYVGADVYFKENESKHYKYKAGSLQFCCALTAIQFSLIFAFIVYTFILIRRNAHVLQKAEKLFSFSFIIYIAMTALSLLPFITTIVASVAASQMGFEDEAVQKNFKRGVGSGFIMHIIATIFQLISCGLAVVFSKFCQPKDESNYDAF